MGICDGGTSPGVLVTLEGLLALGRVYTAVEGKSSREGSIKRERERERETSQPPLGLKQFLYPERGVRSLY